MSKTEEKFDPTPILQSLGKLPPTKSLMEMIDDAKDNAYTDDGKFHPGALQADLELIAAAVELGVNIY